VRRLCPQITLNELDMHGPKTGSQAGLGKQKWGHAERVTTFLANYGEESQTAGRTVLPSDPHLEGYCYCPVPLSVAICGLVGALSTTRRLAVRAPLRVGAKFTVMVQFAPGAKLAAQVRDEMTNCPGFAPLSPIALIVNRAVPLFVSVNVCAVPWLPRVTVPKFQEVGESTAAG